LLITLLLEISLPMAICGAMSLIIFVGPCALAPAWWDAIGSQFLVVAASLVPFFGVGFCFFGVVRRTSVVKVLLFGLSMLVPVATYPLLAENGVQRPLLFLMGWSVPLLASAWAFFNHVTPRDQRKAAFLELANEFREAQT
jgi:hypothetical protein